MSNLQLVVVNENSQPTTDSRRLAEAFGARHDNVLRKIESILADSSEKMRALNFEETSYCIPGPNGASREEKIYRMTRDGFMHIALTFSGKKGCAFREKVIDAFNEMEQRLSNITHKKMGHLEILQGTIQELIKTNAQLQLVAAKQEEHSQQIQQVTEHASHDRLTASQIASIEDRLSELATTITSSPEARLAFRRMALRRVKQEHLTSKHISGCTYKDIHASRYEDILGSVDSAYEWFTKRPVPRG
jgi:Rha family phage regulatory protein